MQSPFFLITIGIQIGINKKITFNKHFARKYLRAYTIVHAINLHCIIVGPSYTMMAQHKATLDMRLLLVLL